MRRADIAAPRKRSERRGGRDERVVSPAAVWHAGTFCAGCADRATRMSPLLGCPSASEEQGRSFSDARSTEPGFIALHSFPTH